MAQRRENSAAARLTHATIPYVFTNGVQLADDYTDLTDGSIDGLFRIDQNGAAVASNIPFTGTGINGAAVGGNCAGWTSTGGSGRSGFSEANNNLWTDNGDFACNVPHRLFCLQQ